MATSTKPSRQGRPNVSVTITAPQSQASAEAVRRSVGIARQHSSEIFAFDIRLVDPCVGADETMLRF